MEYIHGQPLNDFLASNKLDLTEKIRIFLKIAAAVNYAHQRRRNPPRSQTRQHSRRRQ